MTIVREIADALQMLGSVVDDTRSVVKAVNDGREYLERHHKGAASDFAELLEQMKITVEGLAAATGVVTGFRFVVGSDHAQERDLARFNEYVVQERKKIVRLQGNIRKLKADCSRIGELRDALNKRVDESSWSSGWGLLGEKRKARREELASTIGVFYADDEVMIDTIQQILRLAQKALSDVNRSLGEAGVARPHNVPRAAKMLGMYAAMLEEPQQQLDDLVEGMSKAAAELQPPKAS